jgi:acetyl esterase/lipase
MRRGRLVLLLALLALLPRPALAATTVVYRTIDGQSLRADICRPSGTGPFPGLVLVHGGGWTRGSRTDLATQCSKAASSGFVGLSIDYRLAPDSHAPAPVEDLRAALAWARAHASEEGIDAGRVYAMGFSAGGHLVLRVGTAYPSEVRAVSSFSGPTDLTDDTGTGTGQTVDYLGCAPADCPETARSESPLYAVTASAAPTHLSHGTADPLVPYAESVRLRDALAAAGVPVGTCYQSGFLTRSRHAQQLTGACWASAVAFLKAR